MKKQFWAGIVGGSLQFYGSDPTGNVEGLEGTRKFCVENNNLVDDHGASIITTPETVQQQPSGQQPTPSQA